MRGECQKNGIREERANFRDFYMRKIVMLELTEPGIKIIEKKCRT